MVLAQSFGLKSGGEMPAVGLGTWQLEGDKGHEAIVYALQHGYRMLDAAYAYFNQETVGRALRDSGVPREEVFVVDKLANTWHTAAGECLDVTLQALGVDYLDLWLMHWPSPLNHHGNDPKTPRRPDGTIDFEQDWDYVKTWEAMVAVHKAAPHKVRRIGVANFSVEELERICDATGVVPDVNQVEMHPANNQQRLHAYCRAHGIQLVAYSPLGSIGSPLLSNAQLVALAHSKGVASGWPVIPRSQSPGRLDENLSLVDLTPADVATISAIGLQNKQRFINAPWHTFADAD